MKNLYKFLTVILLVQFTGITATLFAQPGYRNYMKPGENYSMLTGIPDLTEEHKEQIRNLHTAYLKNIQPLKNDMKINKAKLDALLTEDQPDMNEIYKLIDDNGKIRTELHKKQVAHRLEIRNLLTDEQKIFFDSRPHRDAVRPQRDGRAALPYHQYRHFR